MKITIMRGVPGSGKSTYAYKLAGSIVSADKYFIVDGEYRFDPAKLGDAHKYCMREFLAGAMEGVDLIVDNTNINLEDIAPYVAVGEAMGYEVEVVQVDTEPTVAAGRNVHGVPLTKVLDMYGRMNRVRLPKRWKVTRVPTPEIK